MKCHEYQLLISTQFDNDQLDDHCQQHLLQCVECKAFYKSFCQIENLYQQPTYPFDSSKFVASVIKKTSHKKQPWKLVAAAVFLCVCSASIGFLIKTPEVAVQHVEKKQLSTAVAKDSPGEKGDQLFTTVVEYSPQENLWKMLRTAISYKNKNLEKSKYIFVEVMHRTESTEVLALASYQLANIAYYKENKTLDALSRLAELTEFIEADKGKNTVYADMGLHLTQTIYLSLPEEDIKVPLARQILKTFYQLSQKQEQDQTFITIGNQYED